jgi:uncharacterized protein (TIGR04222 family)
MLGFDGFNPAHIAGYAAVWFGLFTLGVILAIVGRRQARAHSLPLYAPADLDTYGLAVLAGGANRLRDAALAALTVRGDLPFLPRPSVPPPLSLPSRPRASLAPIVGLPATSPASLLAAVRPEGPHPVEAAMLEAVKEAGTEWPAAATVAADRLADGYVPELRRLDLLPRGGLWAVGVAVSCGVLLVAWSIIGIVAAGLTEGPNGDPKNPDRPVGLIVACALGIWASLVLAISAASGLERNRRGDHVLDAACERNSDLIPCGKPWWAVSPAELALSVALFGLKGWAALPPLSTLHTALEPPPPEPSNSSP